MYGFGGRGTAGGAIGVTGGGMLARTGYPLLGLALIALTLLVLGFILVRVALVRDASH